MGEKIISTLIRALTSEDAFAVYGQIIDLIKQKKFKKKKMEYIRDIYLKTPEYDLLKTLDVLDTSVEIVGTLSTFRPVFPGPASIKKNLHLDFRRNTEKIQEELRKEKSTIEKTTLDSLLSCSAGQMVFRDIDLNMRFVQLGLYQSIVRNSIPVIVEAGYFEKEVKNLLKKSSNPDFLEAKVIGHVIPYENVVMEKMSKYKTITNILDWRKFDVLRKTKALLVDGKKFKIKFVGNPRYLDGDIWVAAATSGKEEIISRFLELTNEQELKREKIELKNDCLKFFPKSKILGQFDNTCKLFESQIIPG
jgi:hypothetical protein